MTTLAAPIFSILLSGTLALTGALPGAPAPQPDTIEVAFVLPSLAGTSDLVFKNGAEDQAKELGVNVSLLAPNLHGEPTAQDAQIQADMAENMIGAGVDALCVRAIDPTGSMVQLLSQAEAAGIPVVLLDTMVDYGGSPTLVSADSYAMAYDAASYAARAAGTAGQAAILLDAGHSDAQGSMEDGFADGWQQAGRAEPSFWHYDAGMPDADAWLQDCIDKAPGLTTVCAGSYDLAQAALRAAAACGRDLAVVCCDRSLEAAEAVRDGELLAVAAPDEDALGRLCTEQLVLAAQGEPLFERIAAPAALITRENAASYCADILQKANV